MGMLTATAVPLWPKSSVQQRWNLTLVIGVVALLLQRHWRARNTIVAKRMSRGHRGEIAVNGRRGRQQQASH